jgi:hypothetical protein
VWPAGRKRRSWHSNLRPASSLLHSCVVKVLLGTMLTKNLRVFGHKVPLYPLFMVSGAVCDIFQAIIDYFISKIYTLDWGRTTVCWTLSYTLSIILRHSSHRLIVFGDYEGTYCMSLTRTYMAYSSAIVISMFANHQLVSLGLAHREAWVVTMLFTGIYNFFVLKASWRVINKATGKEEGSQLPNKLPNRDRTSSVGIDGNRERTHSGSYNDTEATPNRKRSTSLRVEGNKPLTTLVETSKPRPRLDSLHPKDKDSSLDLVSKV